MIEIKVTVTNQRERENAEYVRDHFEQFAYALNGAYLTVFEGSVRDIDTPASIANEPTITEIWNTVFGEVE
jgi:hypothetical protein